MEPLSIIKYPHPALSWRSKPVVEIDRRLRDVVARMLDLMYEAKGVGLAANQVALPWRVFVINPTGDPDEADQELVFLNPEIVRRKGSIVGEEGCLSFPDLYADVPRAARVAIEAFDLAGKPFRLDLDDYLARIVQHEFDHLDGVVFIDRIESPALEDLRPGLAELEQKFQAGQKSGEIAGDDALRAELRRLEPGQGIGEPST